MTTYIIIEKDEQVIEQIQQVFDEPNFYNCIGSAGQYDDAMNIVLKESPEIIFINMDIPSINPIKFSQELSQFKEEIPTIIALTSKKEKAYDVLKNNFYDLILFPLRELEIRKTMNKFKKKKSARSDTKICLKSYKDYRYVTIDEILYLKADNYTTDFFMEDGSVINAYSTLKTFQKILPSNFSRIHKSYIINKNFVSRIQFGKHTCTLKKLKESIPFSKSYADNIEQMNHILSQYSIQSVN